MTNLKKMFHHKENLEYHDNMVIYKLTLIHKVFPHKEVLLKDYNYLILLFLKIKLEIFTDKVLIHHLNSNTILIEHLIIPNDQNKFISIQINKIITR